jgi:cbb3-type cytochrome oxidase maturation protein
MRHPSLKYMDILFLLIPLSVALVFVIGAVFWLALKGGQFDDLESPGLDVVLDDDSEQVSPESGTGSEDNDERRRPN